METPEAAPRIIHLDSTCTLRVIDYFVLLDKSSYSTHAIKHPFILGMQV